MENKIWQEYCKINPLASNADIWDFEDLKDEYDRALADLIVAGIKTATSSGYLFYQLENEAIPVVDSYHKVLNQQKEVVCIVQITNVSIKPFNEVSVQHAFKEGEGDRSLTYWQKSHELFFTEALTQVGQSFSMNMLVVCEEFEVVYPID
ncbi:MAG: ASCH domain-containing protein [Erysipelotrichaceae bacterium]